MRRSPWLPLALTGLLAGQTPPPQTMSVPSTEPKLAELAIEAARDPKVSPIPLDADGSRIHGVFYDRFLLGVVSARATIAAGGRPSAGAPGPGRGLLPPAMVVVAYSVACDGRTNTPKDVRLTTHRTPLAGAPLETVPSISRGAEAKALLPGVETSPSALVVAFSNAPLYDASVLIDYAEPACPSLPKTATLPLKSTPARAVHTVNSAALPSDLATLPSPSAVRVQVMLDRDGSLRLPALVQGPPALEKAALDVVSRWRFEAPRINGVPTVQALVLPITFTADGEPAPAAPRPPSTSTAPPISTPPVMLSSTGGVNGADATHNTTTGSVAGLNRASSRCAVSDDPAYAFSADNPIKVGGDDRLGPSREVRYLNVLRGPNGEGVHFTRRGSLQAPDRSTILDLYELTYDGLEKPLRLYVDEYHFDELKAPLGLVCAAVIDLAPPGATANSAPASAITGIAAAPTEVAGAPVTATPDAPNLTAASSQCPVSDDENYGVTAASPIRVGGGADGPARAQQYLTVLKGPAGQGLRYRRTGAMLAPDRVTMLDIYEVSYTGLVQRVRVYFDRSQVDAPRALKGWACSAPIGIK